ALLDDATIKTHNREIKKRIKHAIYWHHAKPFRPKGGFETLGDIYKKLDASLKGSTKSLVLDKMTVLVRKVCKLEVDYTNSQSSRLSRSLLTQIDSEKIWDVEAMTLPKYKEYDPTDKISEFRIQANNNAV